MKKALRCLFLLFCILVLVVCSAFAEWRYEKDWFSRDGVWGWYDTWVYYGEDGTKMTGYQGSGFKGQTALDIPQDVTPERSTLKDLSRNMVLNVVKGSEAEKFAKRYGYQYDNGEKKVVGYEIGTLEEKAAWIINNYVNDNYKGSALTDREKAEVLHDWITTNGTYDHYSLEEGHSRENQEEFRILLSGTGVCNSYAEAYSYLLNRVDVLNRYISGHAGAFGSNETNQNYTENHAWDLVLIDGQWYHVDPTWDDPYGETSKIVDVVTTGYEGREYFLVSDTELVDLDSGRRWSGDVSAEDNTVGFVVGNDGIYYYGDKADTARASVGWKDIGSALIYNPLTASYQYQLGGRYYFSPEDSGRMATGWQLISGARYFFSDSGIMKTGWLEQDGSRYHLADSGAMDTMWTDLTEQYTRYNRETQQCETLTGTFTYFLGDDGKMRVGWITQDGKIYHLADNGRLDKNTWLADGGNRYYLDAQGAAVTGLQQLPGYLAPEDTGTYLFDDRGIMLTGFQSVSGKKRYFDSVGKMQSSRWINEGNAYYYLDGSGDVVTGIQLIDGNRYWFAPDGKRASSAGWVSDSGHRYYVSSGGVVQTGFKTVDGKKYYFGDDGIMATGLVTVYGSRYYLGTDGVMQTGFQVVDGKKLYFSSQGIQLSSRWITVDGASYYLDGSGEVVTGFQAIDGKRYWFDPDGKAGSGWITDGGSRYYLDARGAVQTGFKTVDGKKYYFGDDGIMATGLVTVDGSRYYMNTDGIMQTGFQTVDGKKRYFDENGVMATGWVQDGGKRYYLDEDGVVQTGNVALEDAETALYYFDPEGALVDRTPGDVNLDQSVDGRDSIRLMKYLAGDDEEAVLTNADVDRNGAVNELDLLKMMQYFAEEEGAALD